MSTAAPTAPAPASAQGGAAPAPVVQPVAVPAGEPTAPRVIKPIPRLPGVREDGPEDASTRPPDTRARDASGRFAAGEPKGGEGAVVQKPRPTALDAADGIPEPPAAEPPPAPKFKFADEEYESQAAAEQSIKSLKGMHKPLQEKAARFEGQLVKAAESARGWHGEAQRLAARVAELEGGAAPPQPQSQPEAPAKGIDWDLYAEISKVANEAGTPWKAQQWLQEQVDTQRAADIAALREEAIEAPRRTAQEQAALAQTADTLVESMAAHKNSDGTAAFPEFLDGEQTRAVGALWNSLGLDPRLALTPGGAVAAVALYRMARAMDSAPPAPAVPTPAPPPPAPDPAAEAAAALDGGRALLPNAGNTRAMDPGVARLVAGLRNSQLIRPGLGFEA